MGLPDIFVTVLLPLVTLNDNSASEYNDLIIDKEWIMVDLPIYTYPGVDFSVTTPTLDISSQLRQEYEVQQTLYQAQAPLVQRFLEAQAHTIADALVNHLHRLQINLPDNISAEDPYNNVSGDLSVPIEMRHQWVSSQTNRLPRINLETSLRKRLSELEQSSNRAVSLSAHLIRHAIAIYMVHTMLPSGHTVNYVAARGEDIPTIPVAGEPQAQSAITATTDAVGLPDDFSQDGRGELLVSYVPAARRFYMPQWVAFNEQGNLLVNSVNEAEAHVASMQRFLMILNTAVALAHYMVADETYQQKRYGMLGQFVNQGRTLAFYQTFQIICTIQRCAAAHELNRGLSLSLPYLDDQDLAIKMLELKIIPAGRIMFVPAFVVLAVRAEQTKVTQDMRLSSSTRKHLLNELNTLEHAFITSSDE